MGRSLRLSALLAVFFAVAAGEAWFMGVHPSNLWHRQPEGGLVDAYAQALASGHAALLVAPAPASADAASRILDASYFHGRYYIYYGIGPFAWAIVPWLKLTGTFLSPAAYILAALLAGHAAYGTALWLRFRDDRRSAVDALLPAAFLAVIVGGSSWALMDLPAIHQVESSSGYATMGVAIACLVAAGGRRRRPALVGAALFAGLTMACRPDCLPAATLVAAAAAWGLWREEGTRRERIGRVLGGLAPLGLVALALAGWNYARFGQADEFGMHYGTGAQANPGIVAFSPDNIGYNLHRYLLGGIRWGRYFPFIDGVREGPIPRPLAIHESVDQVYGSLLLFPVLAYAALALGRRKGIGALLLAAAAGNLLVLAGLGFGTYRYAVDYLGPLSLAAGFGIAGLAELPGRGGRWLAALALVPLLAWSTAAGVCQAVSIARVHRLFDEQRPRDFARLAYPFNQLAYRIEAAMGNGPGAIRLTLSLPTDRYGQLEPLVVDGEAGLEDFIYFYYTKPGSIQVGFEAMGRGGPVSAACPIDYRRPHVVDIWLGSLLPPDDHPLLRSIAPADLAAARNRIRIAIDGRVILEGSARLHPVRSRIFWGQSPDDSAFGRSFTGTLSRVERPPLGARPDSARSP
jgi:hypothetical protein